MLLDLFQLLCAIIVSLLILMYACLVRSLLVRSFVAPLSLVLLTTKKRKGKGARSMITCIFYPNSTRVNGMLKLAYPNFLTFGMKLEITIWQLWLTLKLLAGYFCCWSHGRCWGSKRHKVLDPGYFTLQTVMKLILGKVILK